MCWIRVFIRLSFRIFPRISPQGKWFYRECSSWCQSHSLSVIVFLTLRCHLFIPISCYCFSYNKWKKYVTAVYAKSVFGIALLIILTIDLINTFGTIFVFSTNSLCRLIAFNSLNLSGTCSVEFGSVELSKGQLNRSWVGYAFCIPFFPFHFPSLNVWSKKSKDTYIQHT